MRIVLLLAALVATSLAGCAPAASPSVAPSASAAAPSALPAGAFTSTAFVPKVTLTLPDGWTNPKDAQDFFQLTPAGSEVTGIYLFRDAVAAKQDDACSDAAEPGVGADAKALADWIAARPGLATSTPETTTLGGLRGYSLDLGIREGWTSACPFANGTPTVPLLFGEKNGLRWVVAGSERLRLWVLDLPAGGTVIVDIDAFDGRLIDELIAAATPIVESIRFAAFTP